MRFVRVAHVAATGATFAALALLGACASKTPLGYGVGVQAEREMMSQQADKAAAPNTPGMYLGLIDQMQSQGLYFASLAHIDAYDKQYGTSPDSILLRADALRMTGQSSAAAGAYGELLKTPLAARGYRGLGLLAGAAGDFGHAAQQLQQAVQLAPTDAATLSDLGYARLRDGDVDGARVPLMKAAELDQKSPKIVANVVLYLLANGGDVQALAVMNQQQFAPDVRAAISSDAAKIAAAERARARAAQGTVQGSIQGAPQGQGAAQGQAKEQGQTQPAADARTVASMGIEPAPRLLQRFAQ
ncbi:pilus assembly protein [Paraburkholderia antibiotica]|uniref:Pilus assembly protein n=1 Tax=Paraburkholderia antibiotica TaxID=2728839 RepID=A0A7X9ZXV9_9BURK|nr:pilus assembly protein [Paraburkholderia antibiotica]NML32271.1 pilus assembly protein [Paraburkholderia antibiotica]